LRKFSIFWEKFDFNWKNRFLRKFSIFLIKIRLYLKKNRFLRIFSIFEENFDFWRKFRLLKKILIFEENFDCWRKCRFLKKISIFEEFFFEKSHFRPSWRKLNIETSLNIFPCSFFAVFAQCNWTNSFQKLLLLVKEGKITFMVTKVVEFFLVFFTFLKLRNYKKSFVDTTANFCVINFDFFNWQSLKFWANF